MSDAEPINYGDEPGLRFAVLLDGKGGARQLGWPEVHAWKRGDGVLWVHLERDIPEAQAWLKEKSGIDPVFCEALLAEESRPRVEDSEDNVMVVLRGVNRMPGDEDEDLVPVHLWIEPQRVISVRDRDHFLMALRDIRNSFGEKRGPCSSGELFVKIAEKVVKDMEVLLAELDDEVDELDHELHQCDTDEARGKLGDLRRHAIELRRYLAPQREALFRMQVEDATWLSKRDKVRLREVTDRVMRYVEMLDVLRDRTTILHEDLTAMVSEQIAKTSNRLTAIAALLLPPSVLSGMLGVNVEGIPLKDSPYACAGVVAITVAMFAVEFWIMRKLKWF